MQQQKASTVGSGSPAFSRLRAAWLQDQCCAFGRVPLLIVFEGEALDCQQLHLGAPLHLVLVDLRCEMKQQNDTVPGAMLLNVKGTCA